MVRDHDMSKSSTRWLSHIRPFQPPQLRALRATTTTNDIKITDIDITVKGINEEIMIEVGK
jgi:S-ribosylhomocysteine lyase LuxS involved in autoinducer biosynthesis